MLFPPACDVLAAVDAGAELDFDVTGTGSTPMHIAAGYGSYEVCKLLHSAGAALDVICLGHFAPAWLVFPLSISIVALGLACDPMQLHQQQMDMHLLILYYNLTLHLLEKN